MRRYALLVSAAAALTTVLDAQRPVLVPTQGPLAVTARLRSFVLDVTVPFAAPAALLVLQYSAEGGWTPMRSLREEGPPWHEETQARVALPRRLGRTQVPSGTVMPDLPVDPGLGCNAQGGVYLADSGQCSVGGSRAFGHILYRTPGPRDYRVALLQMPRRSRADIEAALDAIPRADAGRELEQLIVTLGVAQDVGWAVLVVPRAADQLPGMHP